MLNTLRSKQKSILWFLIILVTPAFIMWGAGAMSHMGRQKEVVAKVNGESITYSGDFAAEFSDRYERNLKLYQNYMGTVSNAQKKMLKERIARETVNDLIDRELLYQYAEKVGITVTVDEIKDMFKRYDIFKTNGKFDETKFNKWVEGVPEKKLVAIENSFKKNLLLRKVLDYVKSTITVNDEEVKDFYLDKNKRIYFSYAKVDWKDFKKDVKVNDKDLKAFYEEKKELYRVPAKVVIKNVRIQPQNLIGNYKVTDEEARGYYEANKKRYERDDEVNVEYVKIRKASFLSKIKVSNKDIRDYYKKNREEFNEGRRVKLIYAYIPKSELIKNVKVTEKDIQDYYNEHKEDYKVLATAHASHILIRVDDKMSKKEKEKKLALAKKVLAEAKNGKDFAELAKKYSEGPTKTKGGDLGYFKKGQMVPAFDKTVFEDLKVGEISDLVKTRFGYHIIKLWDKKETHYASLKDKAVRSSIEKKIKDEKGNGLLKEKLNEIATVALDIHNFNALVSKFKMTKKRTKFLSKKAFMSTITGDRVVADKIFSASKGEIVGPVIAFDTIYIFKPIAFEDKYYRPISDKNVVAEITKKIKEKEAFDLAKKSAEKLYNKLKLSTVDKFEDIVKGEGYQYFSTGFFTGGYSTFVPGFGYDMNFKRIAFSLKYDEISKPVKVQDGYAIVKLLERRSGYIPSYSEIASKVKNDLLIQKALKDIKGVASDVRSALKHSEYTSPIFTKYRLKISDFDNITERNLPYFFRAMSAKDAEKYKKMLFDYSKGDVLPLIKVRNDYYVVKIVDSQKSYIKPFSEVKAELAAKYIEEKAKELAKKSLTSVPLKNVGPVSVKKSFDEFVKADLDKIVAAAKEKYTIIEKGDYLYYIKNIKVDTSVLKDMDEKTFEATKNELLNNKYETYLTKWLAQRRKESSIKIYPIRF